MADQIITLEAYVPEAQGSFMTVTVLPDGNQSLEMTASGCLFLSSWTKCFTEAFAKGKSWNGSFTLADFKVSSGHVLRLRKPKRFGVEGMRNDMEAFITEIERIFVRQHSQLRFSYPPYFSDFKHRLQNLKMSNNVLSEQCKLLLENHMCFMPSYDRGFFIIGLFGKYDKSDGKWCSAIESAPCPRGWYETFKNMPLFGSIIEQAIEENRTYGQTNSGAFRFARDVAMHGTDGDHRFKEEVEIFPQGSGVELMIPYHLNDFVARITANVIDKGIDIKNDLFSAKVRCV